MSQQRIVDPTILGIPWKRQLWHKWKASRNVPFRKSWFIGYDLEGNSYWEIIDLNNPHRLRRKVSLDRPYFHFGDFKPHPMWMQWLQYNRPRAPTLGDLIADAQRQHRLKLLAEQAEKKWNSVPLKSSQSGGGDDPRIGSSWTGLATGPEPAEAEERTGWEPQPRSESAAATESPDAKVRLAMEHAEGQKKNDSKIIRDNLGQVKIEKKPQK